MVGQFWPLGQVSGSHQFVSTKVTCTAPVLSWYLGELVLSDPSGRKALRMLLSSVICRLGPDQAPWNVSLGRQFR